MIKTTSPEDCKSILNVSRETIEKFKTFLELLEKWQKKIYEIFQFNKRC